jgi:predicted CxxxxCH...CXXCH cytochrome family protein
VAWRGVARCAALRCHVHGDRHAQCAERVGEARAAARWGAVASRCASVGLHARALLRCQPLCPPLLSQAPATRKRLVVDPLEGASAVV